MSSLEQRLADVKKELSTLGIQIANWTRGKNTAVAEHKATCAKYKDLHANMPVKKTSDPLVSREEVADIVKDVSPYINVLADGKTLLKTDHQFNTVVATHKEMTAQLSHVAEIRKNLRKALTQKEEKLRLIDQLKINEQKKSDLKKEEFLLTEKIEAQKKNNSLEADMYADSQASSEFRSSSPHSSPKRDAEDDAGGSGISGVKRRRLRGDDDDAGAGGSTGILGAVAGAVGNAFGIGKPASLD